MLLRQTNQLKERCKAFGADIIGIADMKLYIGNDSFAEFPFAVSIAVRLDDRTVNEIHDQPTADYADHYRSVNNRLDGIADKVSSYITELGYNAKKVPASQIVDEKDLKGSISHKAVARLAGLGWQGKSLLIVNEKFGPRFRLVTVLTNMPLLVDKQVKNRCGGCTLCTKFCPSQAIKNVNTVTYYKTREEAVDIKRCYSKLVEFKALEGVNATVCGVCVKVCPFGRKKR